MKTRFHSLRSHFTPEEQIMAADFEDSGNEVTLVGPFISHSEPIPEEPLRRKKSCGMPSVGN